MIDQSLAQPTREAITEEARREVQRTVLREALNRYRNELMDEEERLLLWGRIVRLRKQLGLA